jgi:toxin ParE1/3/4
MKWTLRISAQASQQLRDISSYIRRESGHSEMAQAFRRRLVAKARQLSELPGTLGSDRPELGDGIRSTPVGNYILIFRYTPRSLDLLAVIHASRDVVSHFDID